MHSQWWFPADISSDRHTCWIVGKLIRPHCRPIYLLKCKESLLQSATRWHKLLHCQVRWCSTSDWYLLRASTSFVCDHACKYAATATATICFAFATSQIVQWQVHYGDDGKYQYIKHSLWFHNTCLLNKPLQLSGLFNKKSLLTPSTPAVPNCCCSKGPAPYWSNPPCLVVDIRALWRSVVSARAPECQKLKN